MRKEAIFSYEEFDSSLELGTDDRELLEAARQITKYAYAPYSQFNVGAAVRLSDGTIHTGTNQENVSFPVGMCAEQTLFMGLTTKFNEFKAETLAVSYSNLNGDSCSPISPCGKCRQFLTEFESRMSNPIRLIMAGQTGRVQIVKSIADLLPLSFARDSLNK